MNGDFGLSDWIFVLLFPIVVVLGLLFLVRNYIKSVEWFDKDDKLEGKTIVITGGSSGLGKTLSVELARRGARVIVACRTKQRRDSTAFFLRSKTGSFNIRTMYLDLTRLDSVYEFARELAETEDRIDILVNNAAIYCPKEVTMDGLDMMMGVNYVGHFLLVNLLADKLQVPSGDLPRVINVVCGALTNGKIADIVGDMEGKAAHYDFNQVYANSKLALYLFTKELDNRFHIKGIMPYAVDPGLVETGLRRYLPGNLGEMYRTAAKALYRSQEEGIQGLLSCVSTKGIEKEAGKLFCDGRIVTLKDPSWTPEAMSSLWDKTKELIESKGIKMVLEDEDEEEEEHSES